MSQSAAAVPPPEPHADGPGRFLKTKRGKLTLGALLAIILAGAGAVFVAMHHSTPPAKEPVRDVPRREGNAIVVSERFREMTELETQAAASTRLVPLLHTVGTVTFDPTHVAAVGTRAAGIVTKVLHVEGDSVQKGDLLAEIESGRLADAHAALRVAVAKKRAAAANFARVQGLMKSQLTTARAYEQARSDLAQQTALATAAQERIDALGGGDAEDTGVSQLLAPVGGVIAERSIAPGQSLEPGHVAFRVGDLDQLWVLLRIFERDVGVVSVGDAVDVRSLSELGRTVRGTVTHVGAVLDPATRTVDIRVVVPNREQALRPGQSVKATIHTSGRARTGIAVPASAVTYIDGAPTVFVAESALRFVPRKVELGVDAGDLLEIVEGVREGELVVSKNVLAIKSEIFR